MFQSNLCHKLKPNFDVIRIIPEDITILYPGQVLKRIFNSFSEELFIGSVGYFYVILYYHK